MEACPEHPFVHAVARTIDGHADDDERAKPGLLAPGERVVVGVSGGPDSVALAAALAALARRSERKYVIELAHLDHGLRGAEAEADAKSVRDLAERLELAHTGERRDVSAERRRGPGAAAESPEAAARRVRYEFLAQTAHRAGAGAVAVGHTRDDQVETVLLRLLRGGSLGDLAGMPLSRPLTPGARTRLIRPLLEVGRSEVLEFLAARRLTWRTDATNRDLRYLRNRIRHDLLPLLEARYNPHVRQALLQLAGTARQRRKHLLQEATSLLSSEACASSDAHGEESASEEADSALPGNAWVSLPLRALAQAGPALREACLRRLVARLSRRPVLSENALARIERLMAGGVSGKEVPLGGGLWARRAGTRLILERGHQAFAFPDDGSQTQAIDRGTST